jgi:hypothetical protein
MHMARGGDAQGGEGGCTCILCIPPGYATECCGSGMFIQDPDPESKNIPDPGANLSITASAQEDFFLCI